MEYHDYDIFPLMRHFAPPPNTNDGIKQYPAQGKITVEGDLEQLNGDSVRSDSLSARQRADVPVSSCIVGLTPRGMFSSHWSRPSAMFGSR